MDNKENIYTFFSPQSNTITLTLARQLCLADEKSQQFHQTRLVLVTEGTGRAQINNSWVDISEGDVLFFDSMQSHIITSLDETQPLHIMSAVFDIRSFLDEDYKVFNKSTLDTFFSQIKNNRNIIDSDSSSAKKISNTLLELEEELSEYSTVSDSVIKALVILLYTYTVRYFSEGFKHLSVQKVRHYSEVQKTMVYINENLSENLTLGELARIANMNKSYYSTIFKKVTGMTVWEYILNARIELAISYLVKDNAEYNITEILGLCGFNNPAAFNKTFKKFTGKTPTEFKNSKYNSCFSE